MAIKLLRAGHIKCYLNRKKLLLNNNIFTLIQLIIKILYCTIVFQLSIFNGKTSLKLSRVDQAMVSSWRPRVAACSAFSQWRRRSGTKRSVRWWTPATTACAPIIQSVAQTNGHQEGLGVLRTSLETWPLGSRFQ